jgi:hypothetical protein
MGVKEKEKKKGEGERRRKKRKKRRRVSYIVTTKLSIIFRLFTTLDFTPQLQLLGSFLFYIRRTNAC